MTPKYFVDDQVTFTFEGKQHTGVIQGLKQENGKANGIRSRCIGVWMGGKGQWVKESWILVGNSD